MILLIVALTGCGSYSSSWKATIMVQSNESDSAYMRFSTFEGTMVFKLKPGKGENAKLNYSAKLESGDATIYYDCDGTKKELAHVSAGDDISSSIDDLGDGKIYIIVESDGQCKEGDFNFDIK